MSISPGTSTDRDHIPGLRLVDYTPLVFTYEAIKDDPGAALQRIVSSFALPIVSRDFSYIERASDPSNDGAPPKSEIRERFLRTNRRISQGSHAHDQINWSDVGAAQSGVAVSMFPME
jgi:hypothetical protein